MGLEALYKDPRVFAGAAPVAPVAGALDPQAAMAMAFGGQGAVNPMLAQRPETFGDAPRPRPMPRFRGGNGFDGMRGRGRFGEGRLQPLLA